MTNTDDDESARLPDRCDEDREADALAHLDAALAARDFDRVMVSLRHAATCAARTTTRRLH